MPSKSLSTSGEASLARRTLNALFSNNNSAPQKSVPDTSTSTSTSSSFENITVDNVEYSLPSVPKEDPTPADSSKIKINQVVPFEIDDLDDTEEEEQTAEEQTAEEEEKSQSSSEEEEDDDDEDEWFDSSSTGLPAYELLQSTSSQGTSLAASSTSINYTIEQEPNLAQQEEDKVEPEEDEVPKQTVDEKEDGFIQTVKGAGMVIALEVDEMTMAANEQVESVEKSLKELDESMGFSKTIEDVNDKFKITETIDAFSRTVNDKTAALSSFASEVKDEIGTKIYSGLESLRETLSEFMGAIQTTEPSKTTSPTTDS